jgi:hypothetical protein
MTSEFWDDNKIILFSTKEISMSNFKTAILDVYNKQNVGTTNTQCMHGRSHLGSRPSAQNWTIPMSQLECVLSLHGVLTLLGFCWRYGVHYRLLSTCVYRLLPNLPWLILITFDNLLCTLGIILDTFEDIHLFLSRVWKTLHPHFLAAPAKTSS